MTELESSDLVFETGFDEPVNTGEYICFPVSGTWKCVSMSLWDDMVGPKPEWGYINNGCTLSPDNVWGYDVWVACVIHDWHYDPLGPDITRLRADAVLMTNIYKIKRLQGAGFWRSASVAVAYFHFVRRYGKYAYKRNN